MDPLPQLRSRVKDFVLESVRAAYPYMNIDAANEAAMASVRTLETKIQEQETIMCTTLKTSGFLSLSAEIRVMIYELALRPQKDGEGGIKGSRAIFLGVDDREYHGRRVRPGRLDYRTTFWIQQPALTKVSRQVRAECLPVYYGNHFVMEVGRCFLHESSVSRQLGWIQAHESAAQLRYPNECRPVQWLQRIRARNADMITNLEILYPTPVSQTVMTVERLKEYLSLRNIPVPANPKKYLAMCPVLNAKGAHWFPIRLDSVASIERPLRFPDPSEDSLAFTPTNRRHVRSEKTRLLVGWDDSASAYVVLPNRKRKRRRATSGIFVEERNLL